MKKVIFLYDDATGEIKDSKGMVIYMPGMEPFEDEEKVSIIDLMKLGATPDDIIKMKNNGVFK